MKKIIKILSPLSIVGLLTLFTGILIFTRDPGEEGWGYLVAFIVCLFSILTFGIDLILRVIIKNKKKKLAIQILVAVIIMVLYWKWKIIEF